MDSVIAYAHALFALDAWKGSEREVAFSIQGNSMLPLIKPGDRIVLRLVQPQELRDGDLLAFWDNGKVMVHRLIGKKRSDGVRWFCEVGDNVAEWRWVTEGKVLGRVLSVQGAYGAAKMDCRPWTWFNAISAFTLYFWVVVHENIRAGASAASSRRLVRLFYRANKKLLRAVGMLLLPRFSLTF